jgi:TetR/AcrR family transcriptional repressor of nem operon
MGSQDRSRNEIMEATYRALCEHGYSDLTIQKIAGESEKGKSLIYYHFDDKHDLVISFLDHMLEEMGDRLSECLEHKEADGRIDELLERTLAIDRPEMWEFRKALFEMRAQAIHDKEISTRLQKIDEVLEEYFEDLLRQKGSEQPEIEAEVVLSVLDGFMERNIALDKEEDREEFKEYIVTSFFQ